MAYAVYTLGTFDKEMGKLSVSDQNMIEKIFKQLKNNPYVGDQIRYRFFREKRLREKRLYYLVYDDLSSVLMITISGKKVQQDIIDDIVKLFPEYKELTRKLVDNDLSNSSYSSSP
jgi:mRNA-degrading endonuclease RelE of RelBE toxin-antitoxin system